MQQTTIISTSVLWIILTNVDAQVDRACYHPLGMQDKRIPDYYLTASSSYASSTGPKYARLGRDEGSGAWCPSESVEPNSEEEFLQIQLVTTSLVSRIATQGRFGNGDGQEYAKNYKVKYSRDGRNWKTWSNLNGIEILSGNTDTNTINTRALEPKIAGVKYLRIVPVTTVLSPVCLRVEIYGCKWQSGLMSYSIPTPEGNTIIESRPAMLSDDTFDGGKTATGFTQGLGQLADGVQGEDIQIAMSRYPSSPIGFDFVGWTGTNVEIVFQFDGVRRLTKLRVYSYVDETIGAVLFTYLHIYSSKSGTTFNSAPQISFNSHQLDSNTARFRPFDFPLKPEILASSIKCRFEIPRGRFLLSEVEFENEFVSFEYTKKPNEREVEGNDVDDAAVTQLPSDNDTTSGDSTWVIVGVLVGVIALLVVLIAGLCYRQRRLRKTMTPSYLFHSSTNRDEPLVTLAPRIDQPIESESKMPIYHEIAPTANPSENVYHEPRDAIGRTPPPPYQPSANNDNTGSNGASAPHYAETGICSAAQVHAEPIQGVSGNNIYAVPWSTPSPKRARRKKKGKKFPNGSNKDVDERKTLLDQVHLDDLPPEFPREKLDFIEKLGEGQFGEVHLCRADPLIRTLEDNDELSLPGSSTSPVLVAVKVLREDATKNAKDDFLKEVRVMSRLLHRNIVRLLAVCTEEEPLAMVTEYMEHGDLNQYLQEFDDEMKDAPGKRIIRSESLVKIAVQVAAGMDYLSSLNFVHRDLAARNCLLGAGDEIRIGDFGMSRNMYQSDYYRIQGRAVLPIRWMAWECVSLGKFSSASDVWSFGVTLWEIYALCKHQPYANRTDQEVIENMQHLFNKTGKEIHLPRPKRCPATTYNMMRQCWKREPTDRPTFQQLHSYILEKQHTANTTPKPKRPQVKPPVPLV